MTLITIAVVLLLGLAFMVARQIRKINRDITTLFNMRANEVVNAAGKTPDDAAAFAVDKHVAEYHRSK